MCYSSFNTSISVLHDTEVVVVPISCSLAPCQTLTPASAGVARPALDQSSDSQVQCNRVTAPLHLHFIQRYCEKPSSKARERERGSSNEGHRTF